MKPNHLIKATIITVLSIYFLIFMTGCYDSREIDDLAFASAVGLDKGVTNDLRMTLQIMIPLSIGGGDDGGGGSGGDKKTTVSTVETPTIYSGLNMINNYTAKQIDLSHAKLLVISEELAREGVGKYMHAISRGRQLRGTMHVVVSKSSAEDYIKKVEPTHEQNISKYHELRQTSHRYTSFTADTRLINFYFQSECTCSQAVATLVNVSKFKSTDEFDKEASTHEEKGRVLPLEGDYIAGNIPQVGDIDNEIMGLAVFDGDKMVGEIDGEDTTSYLMVTGQFKRAYITMMDPIAKESFIVLDVKQRVAPKKNAIIRDGIPYCEAKIRLDADILAIQSGINYESPENIGILENAAEDFLKNNIDRFLEKTARELNSDICSFGREIKKKLMLWEDWEKMNWLSIYKDASFNTDVELNIRRTGLIIRTGPIFSTKGEEY